MIAKIADMANCTAPLAQIGDDFADRTPWSAGAAAVFGCITIALSLIVAKMAQPLHAPLGSWLGGARVQPGIDSGITVNTLLTMLVLQTTIIALAWWAC
jgi:uncharacterized membrane protein